MIRLSLGLSGSKVWRRFISMNGMPYMWDEGDIWPGYDQKHRAKGPAVVYPDGRLEYWVNDQRHRLDGPAVVWPDGTLEYWINDQQISEYEMMFIINKENS